MTNDTEFSIHHRDGFTAIARSRRQQMLDVAKWARSIRVSRGDWLTRIAIDKIVAAAMVEADAIDEENIRKFVDGSKSSDPAD